ncbi:MAG TPA: hypothetical protein VD906_02975 [Caulobacteraceae bacterium]|nr:hypothetical protein [Caulobacteraceae bacterium]
MYRPLIAAGAALALAACVSTPTVYAPAAPAGATTARSSVGFSEYKVESDRYRVTFQGGPGASERLVNDYAFLRAAEITIRDGYDWFQVVDRFGEASGSAYGGGGPRISVGASTGSGYGRYGGYGGYGRGGSFGIGVGTSFPLGGRGYGDGRAHSRTIEIVMGKGAKPADPAAYDARQVAASLAPNNPVSRY